MAAIRAPIAEISPSSSPRRMTEEEFVVWCDEDTRAEWIDGDVIVASPASFRHVDLVGFLVTLMRLVATQRGLGLVLGPELQVRLGGLRRRRIPDVLFVAKDRLGIIQPAHVEGAPDLVIEIVSPDSLARDWREKYLEYESAGVREYWIIDPMAQKVEVNVLGEAGRYHALQAQDGRLNSEVLAGFYLKSEWLWQEPLPSVLNVAKELGVI